MKSILYCEDILSSKCFSLLFGHLFLFAPRALGDGT